MSFIWLNNTPTLGASSGDYADYAELLCLQKGFCSETDISRALGRLEENLYIDGVCEYSKLDEAIELSFKEIERRADACGGSYPFQIAPSGSHISFVSDADTASVLYCYLLLATRLNMKSDRKHASIDGTLTFEHVSAAIACSFWGVRAESMVFGTGADAGGFETKVNDLCNRLGEGGCFVNRNIGRVTQKDGKLDVVVWKGFSDKRQGKLIGFGQCKTGRNWKDSLTQLQPDVFMAWMQDPLPVNPVRLFFVSEVVSDNNWYTDLKQAGLIFDRCRLLDYFTDDSEFESTLQDVRTWISSVAANRDLQHLSSMLE